ncbi:alpha/beta fold hydrolase [Kurthia massiliensis]|uniref:alpha/beta fold hydrolase n=1 Tax=Kurthia massiliensis TaxID=1033739 RepID=UPI000289DDC7|nr:alpha/beta fold hydrolase [Kurthia massiliensis]
MQETLVFLHGLGSTKNTFNELKVFLEGEKIETFDLPGHGESDMINQMSFDSLCDWLNRQIVEPSIILGHSLGAIISLAFAAKYPGKVKKLILLDGGYLYARNFNVSLEDEIKGAIQFIKDQKFPSAQAVIESERSEVSRWSNFLEEATLKRFKKTSDNQYELIIQPETASIYTQLSYDFLVPTLSIPITLIAAKEPKDLESIRQKAIKDLKNTLPQLIVKRIDTSHDLVVEDPQRVANLIKESIYINIPK